MPKPLAPTIFMIQNHKWTMLELIRDCRQNGSMNSEPVGDDLEPYTGRLITLSHSGPAFVHGVAATFVFASVLQKPMKKRCASPLRLYDPLHVAFVREVKRKPYPVLAYGTSAVGCKNKHSPVDGPTLSITSDF